MMTLPLQQRAASLVEKVSAAVLFKYVDPDGKDFYLPKKMATPRSPYSGKSFSAHPERVSLSDVGKELKTDSKSEDNAQKAKAGTLWKYVDDEGGEFFLPEKKTGTMKSPYSGKSFTAKPTRDTLGDVGKDLKQLGKGPKVSEGSPTTKEAEAPKKAGELQSKYLMDSVKSSHEALRIFDNELASLEKDAKNFGAVPPPSVMKALKLIEKFRSMAMPLAETLTKAQSELTQTAKTASLDLWKVHPEFGTLKEGTLQGPADTAADFLNQGESHPAMQVIKKQFDAVMKAQSVGQESNTRLSRVAGTGDHNAPSFVRPVISQLKELGRECLTVADQLQKRTQK